VQASMAEKNRLAQASKNVAAAASLMGAAGAQPAEPTKLVVSELHPNISQSDITEVFSPFGEMVSISMPSDPTGALAGVAHLIFQKPEDAKAAQEAINGLELAGKSISVALVFETPPPPPAAAVIPNALPNMLPNMMGMGGGPIAPGAMSGSLTGMPTGALGLAGMMPGMMQPGSTMPIAASMVGLPPAAPVPVGPPSRCALLKNMFDPNGDDERNDPNFFDDLCEDVTEEVSKHGNVLKAHAVPQSAGHLYFKFATEDAAAACVQALNGRWFAGKQVQAGTVSEDEFPSN